MQTDNPLTHKQDTQADIEAGGKSLAVQFSNVCYTVNKDTDEEKKILHDVSCTMHTGSLVAVMGPSGAGKTTFLNLLLQNAAHHQDGSVSVSGHPITHGFSKICNAVPQVTCSS